MPLECIDEMTDIIEAGADCHLPNYSTFANLYVAVRANSLGVVNVSGKDPNWKKDNPLVREQPMTYEDYAAIPEDAGRCELVDGVIEYVMSPSASLNHQLISGRFYETLSDTCKDEYIIVQDIDVILSETEVRRPDLSILHRGKREQLSIRGIEGAPDVVVEILSRYSMKRDKVGKTKAYAKYGVPEYWIVDPFSGSLEQYMLAMDMGKYELHNVYMGQETIVSKNLICAAFTMEQIMSIVKDIGIENN